MNNRSTLGKVAIVCAAVLVTGLVLGGIGYALGGIRDIDKVTEKHSWIKGSPGDRIVSDETPGKFDAVEVTGNADIFLVTDEYYGDAAWLKDSKLLESSETNKTGEYKVIVVKGEKVPDPEISNENGVLNINAKEKSGTSFSLNFSMKDWTPRILICCPKEALKAVSVNVDTGDIMLKGISYDKADLETDTGDIAFNKVTGSDSTIKSDTGDVVIKDMKGSDLSIKTDTGDIAVAGEPEGSVRINSDTGDTLFKTAYGLDEWSIETKSDTGDIVVSESGSIIASIDSTPASYSNGSEKKNTLTVTSDTGDIIVSCKDR